MRIPRRHAEQQKRMPGFEITRAQERVSVAERDPGAGQAVDDQQEDAAGPEHAQRGALYGRADDDLRPFEEPVLLLRRHRMPRVRAIRRGCFRGILPGVHGRSFV